MRGPVLVGWLAMLASGCVTAPNLRGPLPVRNQHPAQLTVMHMAPTNADVLAAGQTAWRAEAAYSSLFLSGSGNTSSWLMDGEFLRGALDGRVGLGGGLQLAARVPGGHASGGFLDDFIIDYHDAFGLPDQDRTTSERDAFGVRASRGLNDVFSVAESNAEWMDVPLILTWQLREPGDRRLGLAVRGGLELPIGDQDRGYGNGQLDYSVGGVADYRIAGVGFQAHLQHTFAGSPRSARRLGVPFEDVTSAGLGVELPLSRDLHALVQAEWETSTLRELGPAVTRRDQVLLWLGGTWLVDDEWSVQFGLAEDLVGFASPDFTVWLGVTWVPR